MITDYPTASQQPELRSLWKEAFGDDDGYLDHFFRTAFAPDRCRCTVLHGQVAAALYWFPCQYCGKSIAYLYAVATRKVFRRQGLAAALLRDTHACLQQAGYAGTILMPATPDLFHFYKQVGYIAASTIQEFTCFAGSVPVSITSVSSEIYSALRPAFLPEHSVLQEGVTMDFLKTQAEFFHGSEFLLCATREKGTLVVQEYLGSPAYCPGILAALQIPKAVFRGPGNEKVFTMYLPLEPDIESVPSYFGLPMD